MRRGLLLVCALAALPPAAAAAGSEVAGNVTLAVAGTRLADLGPTVVFLRDERGGRPDLPPGPRPVIRQHGAHFVPDFLVVTAGQTVEMPNDDFIFHNVFSFSRPNDFDLGVYPAGERRTVSFEHPGVVKLYCSIHESMSGAVLVAPSPWFATVSASGDYRIAGVPPGRYELTVWNEKLPVVTRSLAVGTAGSVRADVTIGGEPARASNPGRGPRPARSPAPPAAPD